MTTQEFKDLETRLSIWRADRHIDIEKQKKGLLSNLLEELTELSRARNVNEEIDAYCDMVVFLMNSTYDIKGTYNHTYDFSLLSLIEIMITPRYTVGFKIGCLFNSIKLLGYNPYKCMLETMKEISSRTGHYDETIQKFIKDTSDEAKAKWYKANYLSCKEEDISDYVEIR